MPPVRAVSESKPSRYDRTRLENQERAYIAASRRTDRGLNARMQSARRASEIHQKRTGRALRVTEVEVLNEALYEEITDVSTQRRRWRAHLHSQSEDFDRTLLACMTSQNQIAAQDVLDQAVAGTWLEEQRDAAAGFVNPDYMQAMLSPHQVIDMSTCNSQNTSYFPGVWATQSAYRADPFPLALPNEHCFDQQSMSAPDLESLNTSRRMPVPTDFAPQTFHPPVWTSTSSTDCSTGPSQRADSAIDHTHLQNYTQQIVPHQLLLKPKTNSTPSLMSPSLPPGNQHLPLGNLHDPGHGMKSPSISVSPRHDFTDRRYSYNPNGKPKSTPSSSTPSPSAHYTPRKPLSFSIQTPASFTRLDTI